MDFGHTAEHLDEGMMVIQTNLDDMNPELTPYITDMLLEKGAHDVFWIPIIMKKGRPGIMLNVLTHEDRLEVMEDIIFRETTTLGLRILRADCHRLGRRFETVDTAYGSLHVKVGYHKDEPVQFAPEYRECEEAAKRCGVPLKAVYEEVRRAYDHGRKAPHSGS